jgi:hypothetical protein
MPPPDKIFSFVIEEYRNFLLLHSKPIEISSIFAKISSRGDRNGVGGGEEEEEEEEEPSTKRSASKERNGA